jgi:hypothetical protein
MVSWARYDEVGRKGLLPPGNETQCVTCPWRGECETRLGPKANGDFDRRWKELAAGRGEDAPVVDSTVPPAIREEDDEDDADGNDVVLGAPARLRPTATDAAGLVIGTASGERVVIDPAVLTTHVAIVGSAGSGKTWMAKVVVEEAIRNGVPVLAIDPQGDLVQFLLARPEAEVDPAYRRERAPHLHAGDVARDPPFARSDPRPGARRPRSNRQRRTARRRDAHNARAGRGQPGRPGEGGGRP